MQEDLKKVFQEPSGAVLRKCQEDSDEFQIHSGGFRVSGEF